MSKGHREGRRAGKKKNKGRQGEREEVMQRGMDEKRK